MHKIKKTRKIIIIMRIYNKNSHALHQASETNSGCLLVFLNFIASQFSIKQTMTLKCPLTSGLH